MLTLTGNWGNVTQTVCSNAHLDRIGQANNLEACINARKRQVITPNLMATTVEAIIGAAYRDSGLAVARTVMTSLGVFGDDADV
jgi:dsRNA-specific ribonuclease